MSSHNPDFLIHAFLLRRRLDAIEEDSRRATMISSLVSLATTASHLAYRIAEKPSRDRKREYEYARRQIAHAATKLDDAFTGVLASLEPACDKSCVHAHTSTEDDTDVPTALDECVGPGIGPEETQSIEAGGDVGADSEDYEGGWTPCSEGMEEGSWTQARPDAVGMTQATHVPDLYGDTYDDTSPAQIVDLSHFDEFDLAPPTITVDDAALPAITERLLPDLTDRLTAALPGKLLNFLYDPIASRIHNGLPGTLVNNRALLAECTHVLKDPLATALVAPLIKKLHQPLLEALSGSITTEVMQRVLTQIKDGSLLATSVANTSQVRTPGSSSSSHGSSATPSKRLRSD